MCFNYLIHFSQTTSKNSTIHLTLRLLNILALKTVFVNKIITDQKFYALCLTEMWIGPDEPVALNEATPTD